MDKLTAIKIKYENGTYSDEIPISVLSKNVEWDNTHTLVDVLGSIDVDVTGTIQDQISQLFNGKISATQLQNYVASQLNEDVSTWLNNNVDPVGSAVIVDSSLTISGAAADAKKTGDEISDLKSALNDASFNKATNYAQATGLYIDTNGFLRTLSSGAERTIIIEGNPNTNYYIKKQTSTIMRVACGSSASLESGTFLTNYSGHSEASSDALVIRTTENEYFIYLQLFAESDSSSLKTITANITTLLVIENTPLIISLLKDDIKELLFGDNDVIPASATNENIKLVGDGFYTSNNNYRIYRYNVIGFDLLEIHFGGIYQFQTAPRLPYYTEGDVNEKLVGSAVSGEGKTIVYVPEGAKELFISTLKTPDYVSVRAISLKKRIDDNELNTAKLLGYSDPVSLFLMNSLYTGETLAPANTSNNIILLGDGFANKDNSYAIFRFDVKPGDLLHVDCSVAYQFQTDKGVPFHTEATVNEKLVGLPVKGETSAFVVVPANANYMFVGNPIGVVPTVKVYMDTAQSVFKNSVFKNNVRNITNNYFSMIVNDSAIRNPTVFHNDCYSLCESSDGYLTRTYLGDDNWGNSMYYYQTHGEVFRYNTTREEVRPVYPPTGGTQVQRNLIIITSGIHGDEQQGDFAMYNFMYQLINNRENEIIKEIIKTTDFIFIPTCCPTGIIDHVYRNRDNVNVNRAFPDEQSGGTLCKEAGYIKSVIDAFSDQLTLHLDVHMFDAVSGYPYLAWTMTDSAELGQASISAMYDVRDYWADAHPSIKTFLMENTIVSCVNTDTTSSNYTETVYDVPAGTIEALTQLPLLNTKNIGKDTVAYIFDEVVNTVVQFCRKYGVNKDLT